MDCRGKGHDSGSCHVSPSHEHSSVVGNEEKFNTKYVIISVIDLIGHLLTHATGKKHCCGKKKRNKKQSDWGNKFRSS